MAKLEELEKARTRIEQTMALPEAYSDGERMRELHRELKNNAEEHQRATTRWEGLASAVAEVKGKMAGLRDDRVGR